VSGRATRRDILKAGGGLAGATGLGASAGCITLATQIGGDPVKVSSKRFTEQEILGYMAYVALAENTDLNVVDQIGLGGSTTNFRALKTGQVDLYWEYTGTAWLTLPPQHDKVITDPQKLYRKVKEEFKKLYNLIFLQRAPLNNTYVMLANPQWAKKTDVSTLSGFVEYLNKNNETVKVVMNAEFQSRPDGWPGLIKYYGFKDDLKQITVKNIGSGLLYQVLGTGAADVGVGFNTNPLILKFNLEVLDDDRNFFPVYNPAPLVDGSTLEQHPSMRKPLNKIGNGLTTERMRRLNKRVAIDKESPKAVARDYLQSRGII
jgi:glycine betaine/choline ABC-type transport system substrate-binding protein